MKTVRMLHKFLISIILTLALEPFLTTIAIAQNNPDSSDAQRQMVRRIRERLNPRWFWDPPSFSISSDGIINGLAGRGLNINLASNDPVDRAYEFFERYGDLFQLENPRQELFLEGVPIDSNGHQEHSQITGGVLFEQRVNLIKVRYAGMVVFISRDTDSTFAVDIQSTYRPQARNVNTTPSITAEQAIDIAHNDPTPGGSSMQEKNEGLVIVAFPAFQGVPHLA